MWVSQSHSLDWNVPSQSQHGMRSPHLTVKAISPNLNIGLLIIPPLLLSAFFLVIIFSSLPRDATVRGGA